jgi:uncharacterized protein (TIGR00299 family) protein
VLAILDPFSGVAGDMFLGALIDVGLEEEFLHRLPATLGLEGVSVRISRTQRCGIGAVKVDFEIPPQPHGRHLRHILEIVDRAPAPAQVKAQAAEAFRLIASIEADVHGTTVERVHLHEVGAVDAILDVVGTVWGLAEIGVSEVRCGVIALGEGTVDAAHGRMPVPAPATARLVEGLPVMPGPVGSGELTTPTGAALVRVLSAGGIPDVFTPRRVGYGAGTKDFAGRPNVFRITLADVTSKADAERANLIMLSADIDDMSPERLAIAGDVLRTSGALDVTLTNVIMKKGRPGVRLEALVEPGKADGLANAILMETSSIGVRSAQIFRYALSREIRRVVVLGHRIDVKVVRLPEGNVRAKAESDHVRDAAVATGLPSDHISALACEAALLPGSSV